MSYAAKRSRLALHALVVLTAIDLGAYGLSYAVYRDTYRWQDYIASAAVPPIQPGQRVALDLARPDDDGPRAGNQVLLRGLSRIDGYAGLTPARRLDYRQPAALRAAGVAAVAASAPIADAEALQAAGDGWWKVVQPLPRVRVVRSFRATDEPAGEISRIDLAKDVLVERADRQFVESGLASNSTELQSADFVSLASDRPGNVVIEVQAAGPAILVLNESYHRGWNVEVFSGSPANGWQLRERRTLQINGDFLGCLVPEGHATVEFRFAPASLRHGRLVSVCGLGLLVIFAAAAAWHGGVSARRQAPLPRFRASPSH
jgi:hypothetical protein